MKKKINLKEVEKFNKDAQSDIFARRTKTKEKKII